MASFLYEMGHQEIMVIILECIFCFYFDEYNYHDSLQAHVMEEIGHWISHFQIPLCLCFKASLKPFL